jgi:hypothetical protein
MSYLLSSQVTSVDNVEFNHLTCPIITASANAILTVSSTPTITGVTKNGSNHLVLASGASYMLEVSLGLYRSGYTNAVVQWYNSTDSAYIGQEAVVQCYLWYSNSARITRFVSRALILDTDITGASVTVYPRVKSVSSSGAALGLTNYTHPTVRVWRIA